MQRLPVPSWRRIQIVSLQAAVNYRNRPFNSSAILGAWMAAGRLRSYITQARSSVPLFTTSCRPFCCSSKQRQTVRTPAVGSIKIKYKKTGWVKLYPAGFLISFCPSLLSCTTQPSEAIRSRSLSDSAKSFRARASLR